jgi:nickel-dependent lactate racemase
MQPQINIPFGKRTVKWQAPDGWSVTLIQPEDVPGVPDPSAEIERSLNNPIGGRKLEAFAGAKTAAVVVSDLTRPVPNKVILPPIIARLEGMGIKPQDITLIVATGLHRACGREDFIRLVGEELAEKTNIVSHNALDRDLLVYCGLTRRGTPVKINRHYLAADLKILTGMIEPHQIVGFSGGAKAVAIGLGSEELIQANHSMLLDERAQAGRLDGNPAREDIDEAGEIAGVDFLLNVVLNKDKQIVRAVAGDFRKAHREGVKTARQVFMVPVQVQVDVVIASPGGFPKDLDLYQTQKGLANAARVVKEKGYIVLLAECPEGVGSHKFLRTMKRHKSPGEVIEYFKNRDFRIGVHKAFQWCRSLEKADTVFLVSDGISAETAARLMVRKTDRIDAAISAIQSRLPANPQAAVIPNANATIPVLAGLP